MTPQLEALARRAIACKGWRWMPGMLAVATEVCGYAPPPQRLGQLFVEPSDSRTWFPDLTDPLTVQALLLLVREAVEPNRAPGEWPMVCTHQSQGKKWGVGAWLNESERATFAALVLPAYDTEAAALVAALEAV